MGEEAAKCQFRHERLLGYTCLREIEPEAGNLCIFHWDPQDEEGKRHKAEVFDQRFLDFYRESQPQGKADCSGFVFPDNFRFFQNRDQDFLPTHFLYAKFGDGASFSFAKVKEWTNFIGATFGRSASFNDTEFEGWVLFDGATFGESAQFDHTKFPKGASFEKTTFDLSAWFGCAVFGNGTNFHLTKFGNHVSFREAIFGDRIRFREATFAGVANFTGATALGGLSFSGLENNRVFQGGGNVPVNFQRVRFERPRLVQFSTANLPGVSFFNTDVSEVNFVDITWPEHQGNINFSGRILGDFLPTTLHFEHPPSLTTLKWLETLCQQLKRNYENKRNYADAGEFHLAEMEYRRQRHWMEKNWFSAGMLWIYRFISGYGERMVRSLVGALAILAFAFITYGVSGIHYAPRWEKVISDSTCTRVDDRPCRTVRFGLLGASDNLEALGRSLEFTLLDLTFQKPEEYAPATTAGKILSLLSRLFFPIQLGLLFVAIKRRFRR